MNRKQRRLNGNTEKKTIYQYDAKTVNDEVMKELVRGRLKMKADIIDQIFGVMFMSLHDEFKWFSNDNYGPGRINRIMNRFSTNLEYVDNGEISLEECNKWCVGKGIKFDGVAN